MCFLVGRYFSMRLLVMSTLSGFLCFNWSRVRRGSNRGSGSGYVQACAVWYGWPCFSRGDAGSSRSRKALIWVTVDKGRYLYFQYLDGPLWEPRSPDDGLSLTEESSALAAVDRAAEVTYEGWGWIGRSRVVMGSLQASMWLS